MKANDMLNALIFGGDSPSTINDMSTSGGESDSGKVLAVNSSGKITPVNLTVGEGAVAVDSTLAVTGAAADAKKTGDEIATLNESLDNFYYNGEPKYVSGWKTGYVITNNSTVDVTSVSTNNQYKYVVFDVSAGDRYYIHIVSDSGVARGYCFIDAETNVLLVSSGSGAIDRIVTAPENTVKLIINVKAANNDYAYKVNVILEELQEHEDEITLLQKNPIFRTENTYNLIDYETDMLWEGHLYPDGSVTNDPTTHSCARFIPAVSGDAIVSSKRISMVYVYDENKQYLSSYINPSSTSLRSFRLTEADTAFVRVLFAAKERTNRDVDVQAHEPVAVYKVTTTAIYSDKKPAIPERQIDGRYVSKDIYHVSIPDIDSEFYRRMTMRSIKRENKEKGALRIGNFNIYGAMLDPSSNWWVVKRELMEYGLNICGFEEVANGGLDDNNNQLYSFREIMTGEQFPYCDLSVGSELDANQRIVSDCEVTTGEYVTYTLTFGSTTKNFGYSHCIVNLPNYHHARAWNKQMSIYACHFSTTGAEARAMIAHMLDVLNADTVEYKVLVADTNCFSLGEDNRPWCWSLFEEEGMYPCLTDFSKSSYRDPISQEQYDGGLLDMIDNVFVSSNMKCINWNIVDSRDYPIAGVSGGAVSDHAMVYADVIFDYVDGFDGV